MSILLHLAPPPFCLREALRYAGVRSGGEEMEKLMEDCFAEAKGALSYRVCYQAFPLKITGETCDLFFGKTASLSLARHLSGCKSILLMGATVGVAPDRLIARYGKIAPARALMMQALGTERIEALCDAFCERMAAEIAGQGLYLTSRFSPGYGDLPLELQRDIFRALEMKKIGLTLNESLLISPTKSVTAIMGLTREKPDPSPAPCGRCGQKNCAYRRNA